MFQLNSHFNLLLLKVRSIQFLNSLSAISLLRFSQDVIINQKKEKTRNAAKMDAVPKQ